MHPLRVRWAEIDVQGIVFNAHYLMYMDVGVTEYFRFLSDGNPASLQTITSNMYVVKTAIDFHSSAKFDDLIDVGVRTARFGKSSTALTFEIYRAQEHLITGNSTYVYAPASQSAPIPQSFRDLVLARELVAPQ